MSHPTAGSSAGRAFAARAFARQRAAGAAAFARGLARARRAAQFEAALQFRIVAGDIQFREVLDSFGRFTFVFRINSVDAAQNPIFAAPTLRLTDDLSLFIPDVQTPAVGTFRPLFVASPNYDELFVAYPNAAENGNKIYVAHANAMLDHECSLTPYRQVPLGQDKWPLFIGLQTAKDDGGNAIFAAECNEKDEEGAAVFLASPSYKGRPDLEAFFFARSNYVDAEGHKLFVARCDQTFDGQPAFVARYNFTRVAGSKSRPRSEARKQIEIEQRMREIVSLHRPSKP